MTECIFCKIVSGEAPSHEVWENNDYLAFLSIFPNTEGVTVVIPKQHYSSYYFDLPDDIFRGITDTARTVAKKIDAAFEDVGRTGMVAEGFGVDHVHLKLFPLHGTTAEKWKQHPSTINDYFETYQGFISSHDADRANDEKLAKTAKKIREA